MSDTETIPKEYMLFLKNIRKREGGELHRNRNETDITTGAGIYRGKHPHEDIFKYIDSVAQSIGIQRPSKDWTDSEIKEVDALLNPSELDKLSYQFYKKYLSGAMLHLFPGEDLVKTMADLYTNSPKGAWKAVQYMIKIAYNRGYLDISEKDISVIDGLPGRKTKIGMDAISTLKDGYLEACRAYMIFGMTLYYIDISLDEMDVNIPGVDKHLKYLKGWTHNRMLKTLIE